MPRKRKTPVKANLFNDFRQVLDLPERLAMYLRELLHTGKADWDFCMARLRSHRERQQTIIEEFSQQHPELNGKTDDKETAQSTKPDPKSDKKADKKKHNRPPRIPGAGIAYKEWSKSKGPGKGRRYFAAPCAELKKVQRQILWRFLMSIPVHSIRHGNQVGSSIMTNAARHAGFAKSVFSIDIVNAFPSVFRSRIRAVIKSPFNRRLEQFGVNFTESDREMLLDSLLDLICYRDRLPQGPPTSPRLLDIVCFKMDSDLYKLLNENSTPFQSYRMTAWSDDITVSTDGGIPDALRVEILNAIRANGFVPHDRRDKTVYYSPEVGTVPVVTGLLLATDGRTLMAPNKVNQLRSRLHHLLKEPVWTPELLGQLNGTLGFISQVYPEKLPSKLRKSVAEARARLASLKVAPTTSVELPAEVSTEVPVETSKPKKEKAPRKTKSSKGKAKETLAETEPANV